MKAINFWLVMFLMTVAFGACAETKIDESTQSSGVIQLSPEADGSGNGCGITVTTGEKNHKLDNTSPDYCRRDRLNYFRLENVRSATLFSLEDDFCDDTSSQWEFHLKTYIDHVSTGWIRIADLKGKNVNDIVVRGVILTDKYVKGGDQKDELSCVRITGSAPG